VRRQSNQKRYSYLLAPLVAFVVVAAYVFVPGLGAPRSAEIKISAWLADTKDRTVALVDGKSGRVTERMPIAGPHFHVVQRHDGAYVVNDDNGTVTRVDGTTMQSYRSGTEQMGTAIDVLTSPVATYMVDRDQGFVQRVDATKLIPIGGLISLGGRVGHGVVDPNGVAWIPVLGSGLVDKVTNGTVASQTEGQSGDDVRVALAGGVAYAVNLTSGHVKCLSNASVDITFATHFDHAGDIVVGAQDTGDVIIVSSDQATVADVPARHSYAVPTSIANPEQAVAVNSNLYILDSADGSVHVINIPTGQAGQPINLPGGGANEIVVQDNAVFVNNSNGAIAAVVNADGTIDSVTKDAAPIVTPTTVAPSSATASNSQPGTTGPPTLSINSSPTGINLEITGSPTPGPNTGPVIATRSDPSPPAVTTTQPGSPSPPSAPKQPSPPPIPLPTAPTSVVASADDASLGVTWDAPGNDTSISSYVVVADGGVQMTVPGSAHAAHVTGLTNGHLTCVRVQAVNVSGGGAFSTPACATPSVDQPTAPGALTAVHGNGLVTLSWTAATPNRTPVNGYRITVSSGATIDVSATTMNYTVGGLANGTSYSFSVSASNTAGKSGPAATAQATPSTTPSSIMNLHLNPMGSGVIEMDWGPASNNGGAPVTGYNVYLNGVLQFQAGDFGVHDFIGLAPGGVYTVTVRAVNLNGEGTVTSTTTLAG
jgi:hypothetical protein